MNQKVVPIGTNQTEVTKNGVTVLYSYQTPVAALTKDGALVTTTSYSRTTSGHIRKALARWDKPRKDVAQDEIDALANR